LIGPFAGVLLDRWWRRDLLVRANLLRAVGALAMAGAIAAGVAGLPFYAGALVVLAVSRFFLAGLSAALPHVVAETELVTANAVSTTSGGIATTVGGALAIGLKLLTGNSPTATYAIIAATAAAPYLASALVARTFPRGLLGPDEAERTAGNSIRNVTHGLLAAARHLRKRRDPLFALAAIGANRLCYGLFAVMTLLLFRNYYSPQGIARSGLAGLTQMIVLGAIGAAAGAVLTPGFARRYGIVPVSAVLLVSSAAVVLGLVLPFRLPLHLLAALCLGYTSQGVKVCVDSQVQRTVSDDYRGRVFALYDAVFNLALVAAAAAALALPRTGASPVAVLAVAAGYLAAGLWWLRVDRRSTAAPVVPAAATASAAATS
jgi:hypothetical protein